MPVPIYKQGDVLIAGIQSSMTDSDLARLKDDLSRQVGQYRARGIIIDVSSLDVLDSFASRTLRTISLISRMRGAETVVVGIQPDVAFAMVQMGLTMEELNTALDLEEGLALLAARRPAIGALQL